eukprot:9341965-Pyramimonas_sp.AAC.1
MIYCVLRPPGTRVGDEAEHAPGWSIPLEPSPSAHRVTASATLHSGRHGFLLPTIKQRRGNDHTSISFHDAG